MGIKEKIIELSRKRYCRPVKEVEKEVLKQLGITTKQRHRNRRRLRKPKSK